MLIFSFWTPFGKMLLWGVVASGYCYPDATALPIYQARASGLRSPDATKKTQKQAFPLPKKFILYL